MLYLSQILLEKHKSEIYSCYIFLKLGGQIKNLEIRKKILKIRKLSEFFSPNQELIRNANFYQTSRCYVNMVASNAHLGFCLFNNTSFSEVFHYKERLYNEYID
jgi:hypothetical protein